jgi:hypothetical protein
VTSAFPEAQSQRCQSPASQQNSLKYALSRLDAISGSIGFHARKSRRPAGTLIRVASSDSRINHPRRILMRSKLAISALVIASMLGATAIASAQMQQQPAPGASSEGNVGPGAMGTKKSSKMKSSTTTGSSMKSGSKKGAAAPGADNPDSK